MDKSAINQVDRLLGNKKLQLSAIALHWIAYLKLNRLSWQKHDPILAQYAHLKQAWETSFSKPATDS